MGRISLIVIVPIISLMLLSAKGLYGQTAGDPDQGSGTTPQLNNPPGATSDSPLIDNAGIVYPRENLDPFGYSSLGGTTGLGNREDTSTLDRDTRRRSNLEANKRREKKSAEDGAESVEEQTANVFRESEPASESQAIGYTSPGKDSGLYTWKDENGVLHVTNDLGTVPFKYQEQIFKESEGAKTP